MRRRALGWLLVAAILAIGPIGRAAPHSALRRLLSAKRAVLSGGVALVLSPDETSPVIAVCIAGHVGRRAPVAIDAVHDDPEARLTLERGGRTVWSSAGNRVGVCHLLPPSELRLGLWLARRRIEQVTGRNGRPRFIPPPGTPEDIARSRAVTLGLEGARAARGRPGAPRPSLVVALAGRFDEQTARRVASEMLDDFQAEAWRSRDELPAQSTERMSVMEDRRLGAPIVHWGWTFSAASEPIAAHVAAAHMLAGGDASRLGLDVVRRRRHADDAFPWLVDSGDTFTVGIALVVSPRSTIDKAQRFVDGALKHLRMIGPSEAEMARFRARWLTLQLRRFESPAQRAAALATHEITHGDAQRLADAVLAPLEVDRRAVQNAAQELSRPRRCTVESYPPDYPQDDPTLERYRLYTVTERDRTLADVGRRFDVGVPRLARDNDWNPKHRLTPGQVLWIAPTDHSGR